MSRLPTPGGDNGSWGNVLNDFLNQEHNADGTLKSVARPSDVAAKYTKPGTGIPTTDLAFDPATQAELDGHSGLATTAHGGIVAANQLVLEPKNYGTVDTTGTTDSSAAVLACLTDALAKGATVLMPPGTIRIDSQIAFPVPTSGGARKRQASVRITGAGAQMPKYKAINRSVAPSSTFDTQVQVPRSSRLSRGY